MRRDFESEAQVATVPNTAKMRNCFFCEQDKPCTLVQLPPGPLEQYRQAMRDKGNLVMLAVVDHFAKSYFTRCQDCVNREGWAQLVVQHMRDEYKLVCGQLVQFEELLIDEAQEKL